MAPRESDEPTETPTSTREESGTCDGEDSSRQQLHVPKRVKITRNQFSTNQKPYATNEQSRKPQREPNKLDRFGREMIAARCPHCSYYGHVVFPEIPCYPQCGNCGRRINPPLPITSHMRRNSGFVWPPPTGTLHSKHEGR